MSLEMTHSPFMPSIFFVSCPRQQEAPHNARARVMSRIFVRISMTSIFHQAPATQAPVAVVKCCSPAEMLWESPVPDAGQVHQESDCLASPEVFSADDR